ncbi:MAG: hypothetical protein J0M29_12630 [Chitinophagales bacterium]|nr:hypothetical protein [Chitinophagales bacterium]
MQKHKNYCSVSARVYANFSERKSDTSHPVNARLHSGIGLPAYAMDVYDNQECNNKRPVHRY